MSNADLFQSWLVKIFVGLLALQCLGGVVWTLAWVWNQVIKYCVSTISYTGAAIGFTGTFVKYAFDNYDKSWWGKWR